MIKNNSGEGITLNADNINSVLRQFADLPKDERKCIIPSKLIYEINRKKYKGKGRPKKTDYMIREGLSSGFINN